MSGRRPIGNVLRGIFPFVLGLVVGGVIAGWVLCVQLEIYPFAVTETPRNGVEAFFLWTLLAMPAILVVGTIWASAAMILLWIFSPYPLVARHPYLILVLGTIGSASIAITLGLGVVWTIFGVFGPFIVAFIPLVIAPLLMLTRDYSE